MKRILLTLVLCGFWPAWVHAAGQDPLSMHPRFALRDADGKVLTSATTVPVSAAKTCGACHDDRYIATHSRHAGAQHEALIGLPEPAGFGGPKAAGEGPMDCFVCHLPAPDMAGREAQIKAGKPEWAATAVLAGSGVVKATAQGWQWAREAIAADGLIGPAFPRPQEPTSTNCGACHGQVSTDRAPLLPRYGSAGGQWATETTGLIYSAQRISASGMNLAGKDALHRPWDVHAERMLECVNCHYASNNPAYGAAGETERPAHLVFEARKLPLGEYLRRPSHEFAASHTPGVMRRCESCHEATKTHQWLPATDRHLAALACESCHVEKVFAPARAFTDATVVGPDGPVVGYRGVQGDPNAIRSLVTGYRPVLLPAAQSDGTRKLALYNLHVTWEWVAGEPGQPISSDSLRQAYLDGTTYHPAVLAALDTNHNGTLDPGELRLDTPAKLTLIRQRLEALGLKNPRIVARVDAYGLHHGVGPGATAIRACTNCHNADSRVSAPVELAAYVPGGVLPALGRETSAGHLSVSPDGRLLLEPSSAGYYLAGHDRWPWVDYLGGAAVLLALLAAGLHGSLRIVAARKRGQR